MILDADGNPIESRKTVNEKIAGGTESLKKGWLTFAAAIVSVGLVVLNAQRIADVFYPPAADIQFVEISSTGGDVEVTLKNYGKGAGLVTGAELLVESFLSPRAMLVVQTGFLNVDKVFPVKLMTDKKQYDLNEFLLELKPDETVVFVVRFEHDEVDWVCLDGNLKLDLEYGQSLLSDRFETTTDKYVTFQAIREENLEEQLGLLKSLKEFSKLPDSSVADFIARLEEARLAVAGQSQ